MLKPVALMRGANQPSLPYSNTSISPEQTADLHQHTELLWHAAAGALLTPDSHKVLQLLLLKAAA